MGDLRGWMFRAARAAADLGAEELAREAGVGLSSLRRIEASDVVETREDLKRKLDGGIAEEVVDRVVSELRRRGYELRPATDGWPAAVVEVGRRK